MSDKALTAKERCPRFEGCEATLCPLAPNDPSWFPGDAICSRRNSATFKVPRWVAIQKKVAKKTDDYSRGYFTRTMLEQLTRVTVNIRGISPDGPFSTEAKDVRVWLKEYSATQ